MPRTIRWTVEKINEGFQKFFVLHGRYPTAHEIDDFPHLPSSKQIQRNYGGLVALRAQLRLGGPTDFTKGAESAQRSKEAAVRGTRVALIAYDMLSEHFGAQFVHREYLFLDDRRTRVDFFVHAQHGYFSVDLFFPKDRNSLIGCLNSKMKTFGHLSMLQYPVIFVMMNEKISAEEMREVIRRKKRTLRKEQEVMTYDEFREYCKSKKAIRNNS